MSGGPDALSCASFLFVRRRQRRSSIRCRKAMRALLEVVPCRSLEDEILSSGDVISFLRFQWVDDDDDDCVCRLTMTALSFPAVEDVIPAVVRVRLTTVPFNNRGPSGDGWAMNDDGDDFVVGAGHSKAISRGRGGDGRPIGYGSSSSSRTRADQCVSRGSS